MLSQRSDHASREAAAISAPFEARSPIPNYAQSIASCMQIISFKPTCACVPKSIPSTQRHNVWTRCGSLRSSLDGSPVSAILLSRNLIIVAFNSNRPAAPTYSNATPFSMTYDNVAGHLALRGDNTWEPLPQDSSPLFTAITADALGRVTELLRARPEQANSFLTLLYWGGDPNATGAAARAQVSVKRRTPLMLAAQFGSKAVMEALLKLGANASTRAPEDEYTALKVGHRCRGVAGKEGGGKVSLEGKPTVSKELAETGIMLCLCPLQSLVTL